MRFLIADDFFISRQLIDNVLQSKGFSNIDNARDGEAALHMIEAAHKAGDAYQIVFLDNTMPKLEGIEVAKRIKAKPEFAGLSIIMISAESSQAKIKEAVAAGVEAYMIKPVTENKIGERLGQVLEVRKQRETEARVKSTEEATRKEVERKKYNLPPV